MDTLYEQDHLTKTREITRKERILNRLELITPEQENRIDDIELFNYRRIFDQVLIDESDPLISRFTSHIAYLDKKLIKFLVTDYVKYLKTSHGKVFSWEVIIEILSANLIGKKLANAEDTYVTKYITGLSKPTFVDGIIQMYCADGDLYKTLNYALRNSLLCEQKEMIMYFLCLLFAFESSDYKITEDVTSYTVRSVTKKQFQILKDRTFVTKNVLISYNFLSTFKSKQTALKFMPQESEIEKKKILFAIQIPKENYNHPYLALRHLDLSKFHQKENDGEILLAPNGIFQVKSYSEVESRGYARIILEFKANIFVECLRFINSESEIHKKLGLVEKKLIPFEEEYKYAISATVSENEVEYLSKLTSLRRLTISHVSRETFKLIPSHLGKMCNLQFLHIKSTALDIKSLVDSIHTSSTPSQEGQLNVEYTYSMQNLRSLQIDHCAVSDDMMNLLGEHLQYLPNLQDFSFIDAIQGKELETLASFSVDFKNLLKLNLRENEISRGIEAFANSLQNLESLTDLDLSQNFIDGKTFSVFAPMLKHLMSLEVLNLEGNPIGDVGMNSLCKVFPYYQNLKLLNLSRISLGNEGMKMFVNSLQDLFMIERLDLSANMKIRSTELKELFYNIRRLEALKMLNLSNMNIQDDALICFGCNMTDNTISDNSEPMLLHLLSILLNDNNISDSGIDCIDNLIKIQKLPAIQSIIIHNNHYGEDKIKKFIENNHKVLREMHVDCHDNSGDLLSFLQKSNTAWTVIENSHFVLPDEEQQFSSRYILKKQDSKEIKINYYKMYHTMLKDAKAIKNTKKVAISEEYLGPVEMKGFTATLGHMSNLTHLKLSQVTCGDSGILQIAEKLTNLAKLQHLNISDNQITPNGMKDFFGAFPFMPNLTVLKVGSNDLSVPGMKALCNCLGLIPSIQHLDLALCNIKCEEMCLFFERLDNIKDLRVLNLHDAEVGDIGLATFAQHCQCIPYLQVLNLNDTRIGNEGMKAFANSLKHLGNLQELFLLHNEIGDQGLIDFSSNLLEAPNVDDINILATQISSKDLAKFLIMFHNLQNLFLLDFRWNKIGDEGIKAFAANIKYIPTLEKLYLCGNHIGDDGVKSLASQLTQLQNLQLLRLSENSIGNNGAVSISSVLPLLPQLQEVSLTRNKIGKEGKEACLKYLVQLQKQYFIIDFETHGMI